LNLNRFWSVNLIVFLFYWVVQHYYHCPGFLEFFYCAIDTHNIWKFCSVVDYYFDLEYKQETSIDDLKSKQKVIKFYVMSSI
jgi:hypothetical protein